jgi:DNA-3-methyladenine glycosylase
VEAELPPPFTDRDFFARPTILVAGDLLGMWLVRRSTDGITAGRIVETEAYGGPEDLASHARAGRTARTAPMFGDVGHAYVYLVYGMHLCLNVVAYDAPGGAEAGAVLIRAIEPRVGLEIIRSRRGGRAGADARLAAGPALVCQALDVTRDMSGHDLLSADQLWLAGEPGPEAFPGRVREMVMSPRIGVDYAAEGWSERLLRFSVNGHPSVSRRG